jgi:hypothetical protein
MKTLVTALLSVSAVFSASVPASQIRGEYVEARTADVYTGPCFANGEVGLVGDLAVFGWRIDKGQWEGTNLDGLSVVGVVRASSTLGDVVNPVYPVKSVLIVDDRANPEQRLALKAFAKRMSGDLLQDIVRVEYQPIRFDVQDNNVHTATATLTAGNLATIKTRKLADADQVCHNENVWYAPLTKVDHAMPALALANSFKGQGLDTQWSSPDKRSAFVATFHYGD